MTAWLELRRRSVLAGLMAGAASPGWAQDGSRALRMGVGAQVTSIDPQYHNISPNNAFGSMVYGALVDTDAQCRLIPGLALSWTPLTETLWEFKLRPGVTFHNGRPFTADDVAFTFERIPTVVNSPGSYSTYIYSIATVEIKDPLTLHLHTKGPDPLLPASMSQVWMLNRATHTGSTIDQFNSGEKAIESLDTFEPDMLISDVIMTGMTGIEAAIATRAKRPSCKILLFSGQAATADLLEKARAQGHEFEILAKPVHPTDLLAKLRRQS